MLPLYYIHLLYLIINILKVLGGIGIVRNYNNDPYQQYGGDLNLLVPADDNAINWWKTSDGCSNKPTESTDSAGIMVAYKRKGGNYTTVLQKFMDYDGHYYIRSAKYNNSNQQPTDFTSWTKII